MNLDAAANQLHHRDEWSALGLDVVSKFQSVALRLCDRRNANYRKILYAVMTITQCARTRRLNHECVVEMAIVNAATSF